MVKRGSEKMEFLGELFDGFFVEFLRCPWVECAGGLYRNMNEDFGGKFCYKRGRENGDAKGRRERGEGKNGE